MFETTNQPHIVVKKLHHVYVAKQGDIRPVHPRSRE